MEIILLVIGIILGFLIGYFFAKQKSSGEKGIPLPELEKNYVRNDLLESEKRENEEKDRQIIELSKSLASMEQESKGLKEKLAEQKQEIEEIQQKFYVEFKNLSNELLDEKSKKFTEINQKNISDILTPLKEKIMEFERKVDETYKEETRERASLKTELENIIKLNQQVSEDANKLTSALKGDKKFQGDWGEIQLETLLQRAGLEKDIHYRSQPSFKDEDGNHQRPDYVINLPGDKNLILDSKVSLVAYEAYFNSEDEAEKAKFLKQHIQNLNNHINGLGAKNYQNIYDINPPDYVLLFVPVEPALVLALKEDHSLFDKALDKNIVLVSTSTLLATLRTISYIWKQENQRRNVYEIARESGALYDKFVGFYEDLEKVGRKIDDARSEYHAAMNKLKDSPQYGSTIIGRIERIKKLGADASKQLPDDVLKQIE